MWMRSAGLPALLLPACIGFCLSLAGSFGVSLLLFISAMRDRQLVFQMSNV